MSKEDLVTNHVNNFKSMVEQLAIARVMLFDEDSAIVMLGTLPESYEGLIVALNGQSNLTFQMTITPLVLLLQEEVRQKSLGKTFGS